MNEATEGERARVDIREAREGDAAGIREVALVAWPWTYREIHSAGVVAKVLESAYAIDSLRRAIADRDGLFLVAESDAAIVGFAHAWRIEGDTAELARIYMYPVRMGGGLGSRLLDEVIARLVARGVAQLRVRIEARNELGCKFYESRGFALEQEREADFFGDRTVLRWYARRLSDRNASRDP